MLQKAQHSAQELRDKPLSKEWSQVSVKGSKSSERGAVDNEESDSDDSIGPTLPGQESGRRHRAGPAIPSVQDLELKRGIAQ